MTHSTADSAFVTKALEGGNAEVELGTLAEQRASNDKVKQFGRQMVTDHTKAEDELKGLASSKGMNVPSSMDTKSETAKTRLSRLSGAAFDRAYMEDMVSDHEHDVTAFRKEAEHGTDPDIKAFASKTLPILEEHLRKAQETLGEVKKSA